MSEHQVVTGPTPFQMTNEKEKDVYVKQVLLPLHMNIKIYLLEAESKCN